MSRKYKFNDKNGVFLLALQQYIGLMSLFVIVTLKR